jgi:4'-phosphopantetheinyl transferase EntD
MEQMKPHNIFEVINQNIVDLSQDMVLIYSRVEAIYKALYPDTSEPNAIGTEEEVKVVDGTKM